MYKIALFTSIFLIICSLTFPYSAQRLYFTTNGSSGGTSVEAGFDFNHIWNSLGVGMNGHIYIAVSNTLQSEPSSGSPRKGNTVVVAYNPYNGTMRSCHTVKRAAMGAGNWMSNESQEKIHTFLCPAPDGKLWMATHDNAEIEPGDPLYYSGLFYRGSHILYVDVFNGDTLVDYSATQKYYYKKESPFPQENQAHLRPSDTAGIAVQWHSIMILGLNPHMPRYLWSNSIGGTGFLQVWDLIEDTTRTIGPGPGNMRHIAVGRDGSVYYNETSTAYKCTPNSTMKTIVGTSLPGSISGMCYSHSYDSAFGTIRGEGNLIMYDMVNDTVMELADLPGTGTSSSSYRCLTISADGRKLYIVGNSGNIYEFNIASRSYTSVYNVSSYISGFYKISGGGIVDSIGNWYAGMHSSSTAALLKINMGRDKVKPYAMPPAGIDAGRHILARRTGVVEASPNPFSLATAIKINCRLKIVDCRLKIYNINGKMIDDLTSEINNLKSSILNQITWTATNHPPGIYILKATIGNQQYIKRLLLAR
jgi:hypothetical protein